MPTLPKKARTADPVRARVPAAVPQVRAQHPRDLLVRLHEAREKVRRAVVAVVVRAAFEVATRTTASVIRLACHPHIGPHRARISLRRRTTSFPVTHLIGRRVSDYHQSDTEKGSEDEADIP
jgi:hypothetical protein